VDAVLSVNDPNALDGVGMAIEPLFKRNGSMVTCVMGPAVYFNGLLYRATKDECKDGVVGVYWLLEPGFRGLERLGET